MRCLLTDMVCMVGGRGRSRVAVPIYITCALCLSLQPCDCSLLDTLHCSVTV